MHGFDEIRNREIEERRRSMIYALILLLAIVITVGSIIASYA